MKKSYLTIRQKKAVIDLYIIIFATIIVLGTYIGYQNQLISFGENSNIPVLFRTLVMALIQFGVAGLGITIVCVLRKESFFSYGLRRKGLLQSILFSVLVFIPNVIFSLVAGEATGYMPFQSVWLTKEVLASAFPINIFGIGLITIAWGFFEGFNYVVICEKFNTKYPSQTKWINWGAFICAIMCLLIHGMIGITSENIIEAISVFIVIYGMLMVKEHTGNAWGSIFIFVFLWNAF